MKPNAYKHLSVGRKLGITEIEVDVLPEQKAEVVARLQKEGKAPP